MPNLSEGCLGHSAFVRVEGFVSNFKAGQRVHSFMSLLLAFYGMFPILGNSMAAVFDWDRRISQVLVIIICLAPLVWLGVKRTAFGRVFMRLDGRAAGLSIGLSLILLFPAISRLIFTSGTVPFTQSLVFKLVIAAASIFLSTLIVLKAKTLTLRLQQYEHNNGETVEGSGGRYLFGGLLLAGIVLASIAWFEGPVKGESLYAYGGSSIYTALGACIGIGVMLLCFGGFQGFLGCLPFFYVLGVSTARSGIVCVLVLFVLAFSKSLTLAVQRPSARSLVNLLFAGILPFFAYFSVVALLHTAQPYFPYRTQADKPKVLAFRAHEFGSRYSRFFRVLGALGFDNAERINQIAVALDGSDQADDGEQFEGDEFKTSRLLRRMVSNRPEDSRVELVKASFDIVRERPFFGYWPQRFSDKMWLSCGGGVPCEYPHNYLIELAFYFGLVPLLPVLVGGFVMGLLVLRQIWGQGSLLAMVCSMNVLVYSIFLEITGSSLEHFLFLVLVAFWLATFALQQAPVTESAKAFDGL